MRSLFKQNLIVLVLWLNSGSAFCQGGAEGIRLYNQKDFEGAIKVFSVCIKENPRDAKSCFYLANCCYGSRRFDEAIKVYWYVVKNFPSAAESYSARSFLKQIDRNYLRDSQDSNLTVFPELKGIETANTAAPSKAAEYRPISGKDKEKIIDDLVKVVPAQADRKNVSKDLIGKVKEALTAYPTNLLALVYAKGCKIYLTPTMIDKDPGLQNTQPRGYEDGYTYKNCPGMFSGGSEIVICEYSMQGDNWIPLTDCIGTLRHELGHAVDCYLGWYSHKEVFKHEYFIEAAGIDDDIKPRLCYFLQKDVGGPTETFAELMCYEYGGRSENKRTELVHTSFPTLAKMIDQQIRAIPQF
jgi:tetratricopeptide (TPR) repeat protein